MLTGKKAPAASWLAATGLVKSWMVISTEKKAPAASWLAATGLVESWMAIFTEKKTPAASGLPTTQGLSNPGWPFSSQKKRLRQAG